MGSAAFIHTARIGHICVPEMMDDPNGGKRETGRYLFTNAANNIAAKHPTLAYKIDVVDVGYDPNGNIVKAPVIRWEGEVALTADDACAALPRDCLARSGRRTSCPPFSPPVWRACP